MWNPVGPLTRLVARVAHDVVVEFRALEPAPQPYDASKTEISNTAASTQTVWQPQPRRVGFASAKDQEGPRA
jgi:hypothetical protein